MKQKDIALAIILSIITCGIYGIYWFITLSDEVRRISKDTSSVSGALAFFLNLITCNIFNAYYYYKLGDMVKKMQKEKNLNVSDNSIIYLILHLFLGCGDLVNLALIQNDVNNYYQSQGVN